MNQPPVMFQKYVAIDWSGAERPLNTPKIQVAEYVPANGIVRLVRRPRGERWTRAGVVDYVQQTVNDFNAGPVLIGFDFAFSYPYCDWGTYFPGVNAAAVPHNARALWVAVEHWCCHDDNFYGARFFRNLQSPYRAFHRYPYFLGCHYAEPERLRMTEQAARQYGLRPTSVFKCVGSSQVGTGSVAGMRVLHELRRRLRAIKMAMFSIWPFDVNNVLDRSTIVEIYPRLFLNHAQSANYFGAELQNVPAEPTNDQRDALVSAAGMAWFIQQGKVAWQVPDCAAQYEGWIFGVPAP